MIDTLVVGTGATGGWVAKELGEAGMRVLVLNAGPLRNEQVYGDSPDPAPPTRELLEARRPRQALQSQHYAWPADPDGLVDDIDHPYSTPPDAPFLWIRSRQVGGRMFIPGHGRRLERLSEEELRAAERDGFDVPWPIDGAALAPHYDKIEKWVGRSCPAMNPLEQWFAARFAKMFPKAGCVTNSTAPPPRSLAAAKRTGCVEVRANAIVSRVLVDDRTKRAIGVRWIDAESLEEKETFAGRVILCASTIESTRLLLNSAPGGLGNSSGMLGRYLMDHVATATRARLTLDPTVAAALTSPMVGALYLGPFFSGESGGGERFLRGYGIQVALQQLAGTDRVHVAMKAFGEMLPRPENVVTLDPDRRDRWGVPIPHIVCRHSENELALARDQLAVMSQLVDGGEAIDVPAEHAGGKPRIPGKVNHEVGTARMGRDRETSVLKDDGELWDVEGLHVLDGSSFVSQGYQNPTLTMLALADRACMRMREGRR